MNGSEYGVVEIAAARAGKRVALIDRIAMIGSVCVHSRTIHSKTVMMLLTDMDAPGTDREEGARKVTRRANLVVPLDEDPLA